MHFLVHRCIAMYFSKNANLFLNRVKFVDQKSCTFVQPVLRNNFWIDLIPVKHLSQTCNVAFAVATLVNPIDLINHSMRTSFVDKCCTELVQGTQERFWTLDKLMFFSNLKKKAFDDIYLKGNVKAFY